MALKNESARGGRHHQTGARETRNQSVALPIGDGDRDNCAASSPTVCRSGADHRPLTHARILHAKPGEKAVKLYDGRGLYLLVTPAGGKLWRLKYRFNRVERKLSLGRYPDVSLARARDRRDEARRLLAEGVDPSERNSR